ncbi:MAG: peptide-binding protein [Desulfovibrio sp.]|jgi:peptide/nickel transport system substrate-binding protein|nr:peptide-binding protein [Desulfovibrio sp.]
MSGTAGGRAARGLCFLFLFFAPAFLCLAGRAMAEETGAEQTPVYGDTRISAMIGEPSNLVPYLSSDSSSSEVAGHFYIAPLKYDRDLQVIPYAAESFSVLEEGRRLRFTLKKGIFWRDGVEVTADDAEFTYRMMTDPGTPTAYAGDFMIIKEFRKLDRYSFEAVYEKPFPRSLNTWMGALLPKHALDGRDLRNTPLIRKPLSCGPYFLSEWEPGAKLTLNANPDYFLGRPYIDRLLYRIIPDVTTMFLELKAGKLDVMGSLTGLQYSRQAPEPAFQKEFATYRTLASAYTYMGYNLKSPLFSDVRVRRAIAHAINKADIIKMALLGQGEPTIGPYKPDAWAYNHEIGDYAHDPEKALSLLAEAGWKPGRGGLLEKDGRSFSFTLLTNQGNEQRVKTAIIIQSQLKAVGIEVKIRTVEWAAFLKQFVMPGYFDAIILGWTLPHDPDGYDVWHSSRREGGLNFIGYADAEADACLEAARSTLDQAVRKRYYDRFQEILHRDQPYCFLYVPYDISAVQRRFRGVDPAPAGIFHNTERWWAPLDEQRYRISAG